MTREILFKAKRKDGGKWVDGYYEKRFDVDCSEQHFIFWSKSCTVWEYAEIELSTLCQYTGLTDKNGKKIWENDIVLLREEIQDYEWKAVVKFGNPNGKYNWGWQLVPIGECDMNKDILLWIDMEIANCEVIGNIFDNEDLLEV